MQIRQLDSRDIDIYRTIRLAALAADPSAFGSSLAREQRFSNDEWAARISTFRGEPGAIFVAVASIGPVGVVGIGRLQGSTTGYLWGMWVDPDVRGQGIGIELVNKALTWGRTNGLDRVTLDVEPENNRAASLYASVGFTRADEQVAATGGEMAVAL